MADNAESPPSPSAPPPLTIDGSDRDAVLAKSNYLSRREVLERRSRHCKQLARLYRNHYWVIMDMVKLKHRDYYWTYGKSPFKDDNPNSNSANSNEDHNSNGKLGLGFGAFDGGDEFKRCQVAGCKSKAMALTRFCHVHILSDPKQKLYKGCTYVLKRFGSFSCLFFSFLLPVWLMRKLRIRVGIKFLSFRQIFEEINFLSAITFL